jgi:LPXTG-motif cell wall-anchored protein
MNRVLIGLGGTTAVVWGRLMAALLLASLLALAAVPAGTARAQAQQAQQAQQDIVDTAVAAGQFTTLARALQAAGLADTLKGPGPFTVFAPTDVAFAKLPPGTLEALLANPDQLRAVLTYHVVPGRVTAADVVRVPSAATVQGSPVRISLAGQTVRLNGSSSVVQADVLARNGVIHVIDTVLLPPALATLPQTGGVQDLGLPLAAAGAAAALLLAGFGLRRRSPGWAPSAIRR